MRSHLATLILTASFTVPAAARAEDTWTRPYPGVAHLHHRGGGFDYHVVTIDLRDPRVAFVATDERTAVDASHAIHWTRTSTFAAQSGAEIAVNANYFDLFHHKHSACGLTMGGGKPWTTTYQDERLSCVDSIGFGPGGLAQVFDSRDAGALPWMTEVVTGSPRLIRDGTVEDHDHPHHGVRRNPRTALGLSRDRRTLYLMVVDGREGHALGMTCVEAARTLARMGAWNAINLDGGGSSTLFIRREQGVVSHTGERFERPVGNHFGIAFRDPDPRVAITLPVLDEPRRDEPTRPVVPHAPAPRVIAAAATAPRASRRWSILGAAIALAMASAEWLRRRREGLVDEPVTSAGSASDADAPRDAVADRG